MFYIVAHFILGEILDFYVKLKWWDSFLHFTTGMAIALLSFSFINLLNNNIDNFKINTIFAVFFAFTMTITVGVVWEIIEFASDSWFNTNMQRAYVSTLNGRGEALVGQSALKDTMKDLILDSLGAGLMCAICGISISKKKFQIEDLSFIKRHKKIVSSNAEIIESHKELTELSQNAENAKVSDIPEATSKPKTLIEIQEIETISNNEKPKKQENKKTKSRKKTNNNKK